MKDYVPVNKAADMLGVCNNTIREWENTGKLKAIRTIGNQRRFKLSDIEKLLGEMDARREEDSN